MKRISRFEHNMKTHLGEIECEIAKLIVLVSDSLVGHSARKRLHAFQR
jgi:hypothetical protein